MFIFLKVMRNIMCTCIHNTRYILSVRQRANFKSGSITRYFQRTTRRGLSLWGQQEDIWASIMMCNRALMSVIYNFSQVSHFLWLSNCSSKAGWHGGCGAGSGGRPTDYFWVRHCQAKMTHVGNAWVAVNAQQLKRAESTSSMSAGFDVIQEPDTLFITEYMCSCSLSVHE